MLWHFMLINLTTAYVSCASVKTIAYDADHHVVVTAGKYEYTLNDTAIDPVAADYNDQCHIQDGNIHSY